ETSVARANRLRGGGSTTRAGTTLPVTCNPRRRWSPGGPPLHGAVGGTVRRPFEPDQLPSVGVTTEVGADWPSPGLMVLAVRRDLDQDETARGGWQVARRVDRRRRAGGLGERPALAGRIVELEPGGAVDVRRLGHVGRDGGVLERQSIVLEARRDDGIHGGQIRPQDLVAPFDQDVADRLFGGGVAELARVNDRAYHLVAEGGDALRGPERIVVPHPHQRGVRRMPPPPSRIETTPLEFPDL